MKHQPVKPSGPPLVVGITGASGVIYGIRLLELLRSDLISPLVKVVVRSHHERWGGGGYPDNKIEDEIHELARIAAAQRPQGFAPGR